jgi:hypothetical protein
MVPEIKEYKQWLDRNNRPGITANLPESSSSLLVHFGPWCNPIDSHEEHFLWFDHTE